MYLRTGYTQIPLPTYTCKNNGLQINQRTEIIIYRVASPVRIIYLFKISTYQHKTVNYWNKYIYITPLYMNKSKYVNL